MNPILTFVDSISAWAGKLFAWTIVFLTAIVFYDVIARKLFSAPTQWGFDAAYILFSALFMMAGAYTFSRNGHVRGDLLYRTLSPRAQAWMDLVLYLVFFLPGIAALVYAGTEFAIKAWRIGEKSSVTGAGTTLYHFKIFIPIAGALLVVQALAEITRCIMCIRTGLWPARAHDVEEADIEQLKSVVKQPTVKGLS